MYETINLRGELRVFNKPLTMGILNLTDDSFYAGSRVESEEAVLERAKEMIKDGADILDLGAYSTRPGADDIPEEQETKRLVAGIAAIRKEYSEIIISADTFRGNVARSAVKAGADMINDVGSGLLDPTMFDVAAELKVPYILMHNRGTPKTMNDKVDYKDVVNEVIFELSQKIDELRRKGVSDIIIDPGFGFAKNVEQNFEMLERLDEFQMLDCPILVGVSRKSMIWRTLESTPEDALNGTTALNMRAIQEGAAILRVHDVKEAKECIELSMKLSSIRADD